jgi:hypothetical protein
LTDTEETDLRPVGARVVVVAVTFGDGTAGGDAVGAGRAARGGAVVANESGAAGIADPWAGGNTLTARKEADLAVEALVVAAAAAWSAGRAARRRRGGGAGSGDDAAAYASRSASGAGRIDDGGPAASSEERREGEGGNRS